ncbi:MAG: PilZ domain-containing protein [Sumerlaeia bacterium]
MISETPSVPNRRREQRFGFVSGCGLEIKSPAWAMLTKPLHGETENLTEHGVKVILSDFPETRYILWEETIRKGEYLNAVISLPTQQGAPLASLELPGEVVWIKFSRNDQNFSERGECSIGLLLNIMDADTARALRHMVLKIETQQSGDSFARDPE